MRQIDSPAEMVDVGRCLATVLQAGDVVILDGGLGAGKTTFTRGIGEGLDVRGPVTSPTFVIARVHPPMSGGAPLVHVDAYRVESLNDIDSLDLDSSLEESVTVVEWGVGRVEQLSESYLLVSLGRSLGGAGAVDTADAAESRILDWQVVGISWNSRIERLTQLLGNSRN